MQILLQQSNKRVANYDIIRTIAIICVVLCHAVESVYPLHNFGGGCINDNLLMLTLFTIGRLGVPLFLFLSGSLLLTKQFETGKDVKLFYKRNLFPLFLTNSIWCVIYNVFFFAQGQPFIFKDLILEILLFKQVPLANMWYMPMIIILYIALPFISKIVKTFSIKSLLLLLGVVFFVQFIYPGLLYGGQFLGGAYGFYLILGYYAAKKEIKIKRIWLLIISIICFILTIIWQYMSHINASVEAYLVWYSNPLLLIAAYCLYLIFCNIDFEDNKLLKIPEFLSKISLGIFYLHIIFQIVLAPFINKIDTSMHLKFILLFLTSFSASALTGFAISRSKILSKFVLFMK